MQPPSVASSDERRRCAIVLADLVESVVLMQQFETEVIAGWRRFEACVRERSPSLRLLRTAGDSLLLIVDDPHEALRQALALHDDIAAISASMRAEARLWLRVGLHVADLVVGPHEVYGAGANLAARIAASAQPGQTLMSAAMRDTLTDGLDADFEDIGERYLKHMELPQRLFAVSARGGSGSGAPPQAPSQPLAAAFRPVIAVVPPTATDGDPRSAAAGHALADALVATLGRHPHLRLLSLTSTQGLQAHGDAAAWPQLSPLTGANFLLGGRCRWHGDRLQLQLSLSKLPEAELLWSDSIRVDVDALFGDGDEALQRALGQLLGQLARHEQQRLQQLPMDSLPAYTLYVGAGALMHSLQPTEFDRARLALEALSERHPRQAAPHGMLARWHVFSLVQGWHGDEAASGQRARDHALRAIERDAQHAVALSALALHRMRFEQRVDEARELNEAAIAAAPQDPYAWAQQASVLAHLGEADAAVDSALEALRRSPLDPNRYLFEAYAALAELAAGRPQDAARWAAQSVRRQLLHAPSHRLLIGALMLSGAETEARAAMQRFRQHCPVIAGRPAPLTGSGPAWRQQLDAAVAAAAGLD